MGPVRLRLIFTSRLGPPDLKFRRGAKLKPYIYLKKSSLLHYCLFKIFKGSLLALRPTVFHLLQGAYSVAARTATFSFCTRLVIYDKRFCIVFSH